jgi:hypothetical protein
MPAATMSQVWRRRTNSALSDIRKPTTMRML